MSSSCVYFEMHDHQGWGWGSSDLVGLLSSSRVQQADPGQSVTTLKLHIYMVYLWYSSCALIAGIFFLHSPSRLITRQTKCRRCANLKPWFFLRFFNAVTSRLVFAILTNTNSMLCIWGFVHSSTFTASICLLLPISSEFQKRNVRLYWFLRQLTGMQRQKLRSQKIRI